MLLAIDTSAHLCAAAVCDADSGRVVGEAVEDIGRGHAERLMAVIADALANAGCDYGDLTRIAACAGPGSFTGVRVGLATARGIALALAVPVLGVPALDALALAAGDQTGRPLLVAIDARRGEAYCRFFENSEASEKPFVASIADAAAMADASSMAGLALCGSAAPLIAQAASVERPVLHRLAAPPIGCIGQLGTWIAEADAPPEPVYLRPPDAKPQAGFAVPRV